MDAGRLLVSPAALDGDIEKTKSFMIASGIGSSALEHEVPERQFSVFNNPQAVSAVKALKIANDQGQPIFTITQSNLANILPQLQVPASVTQEIQDATAAGYEVVISKTEVDSGGWTGVGYIILDPKTGSGAYRITGGFNGVVLLIIAITTIMLLTVLFISISTGAAVPLFGAYLVGAGTVPEILFGGALLAGSKVFFIALLVYQPFRDWINQYCSSIAAAGSDITRRVAGPSNPLTFLVSLIGRLCSE
jgi:hypothetical protein